MVLNEYKEKWAALEAAVNEKGGCGAEVVEALCEHYSIYHEGLIVWLAKLFDPTLGGFYYSNSGRDTERYLPDIESTYQATNLVRGAGLIDSVQDFPLWMKKKIVGFVCSLQDPDDGFIYHPQWGKGIRDSRRGRDLMWANNLAGAFGFKLPYPTANERLKASLAEAGGDKSAVKALPEHLKSREAFLKYVEGYDWVTQAYKSGNNLAAQVDQIIAAGLGDVAVDFLNSVQNKETGLWASNNGYDSVNGAFKISYLYNAAKRTMPNAGKIAATAMECITRTDERCGTTCYLYNTWYTIINVVGNTRRFADESANREADGIIAELLRRAPAAIRATTAKIKVFQKEDGSFSMCPNNTCCESQAAPVAAPKPEGGQPNEGDVNASVISSTSLTGNIFGGLELRDYAIPLYGKEQFKLFLDNIEAPKPLKLRED